MPSSSPHQMPAHYHLGNRNDSGLWEDPVVPCADDRTLMSVRSQGHWVAFDVNKKFCNFMFRAGVPDFRGQAHEWPSTFPDSGAAEGPIVHDQGPCLAPHPRHYGVLILDYDARVAFSMQFYGDAFSLNAEIAALDRRPQLKAQLRSHILNNRLREVRNIRSPGLVVPLPEIPRGTPSTLSWLRSAARQAWPTTPGSPEFPPACDLDFPLSMPGWSLVEDTALGSFEGFSTLARQLLPAERAAWETWIDKNPSFRGLRRVMAAAQAESLDDRLPRTGPAVRPPRDDCRPRRCW